MWMINPWVVCSGAKYICDQTKLDMECWNQEFYEVIRFDGSKRLKQPLAKIICGVLQDVEYYD